MSSLHYDIWAEAFTTSNEFVKGYLILSLIYMQDCPEDILLDLCGREHKIRCDICNRSNSPHSVWAALAKDPDARIRSWVASHSNTPHDVLVKMSRTSAIAEKDVLRNRNCPTELLEHALTHTYAKDTVRNRRDCFYCVSHENAPFGVWVRNVTNKYAAVMFIRTIP